MYKKKKKNGVLKITSVIINVKYIFKIIIKAEYNYNTYY